MSLCYTVSPYCYCSYCFIVFLSLKWKFPHRAVWESNEMPINQLHTQECVVVPRNGFWTSSTSDRIFTCPNRRIRYDVLRRRKPCPRGGGARGVTACPPPVLAFGASPFPRRPASPLCHVFWLYLSCVLWLENSSLRLLNQWPSTLLQGKCCPGYSGGTKGKKSGSINPHWTVMWGTRHHTQTQKHAASTTILWASTETSVSWSVCFKGDSHQYLES